MGACVGRQEGSTEGGAVGADEMRRDATAAEGTAISGGSCSTEPSKM
eukprot:CAMPEP_0172443682 /NCGR_PEP_ID=MMETSP1065-20121228/3910_1 /TAXON_ID=265537 /ORGANISM="Amphiprora paludosa, Strain CCMP125" /LENGTH=46 /DNA_ID= /DNA_START= /DNA_END= /DNA_ORIENTATION=